MSGGQMFRLIKIIVTSSPAKKLAMCAATAVIGEIARIKSRDYMFHRKTHPREPLLPKVIDTIKNRKSKDVVIEEIVE
jgi:hypothetical protein